VRAKLESLDVSKKSDIDHSDDGDDSVITTGDLFDYVKTRKRSHPEFFDEDEMPRSKRVRRKHVGMPAKTAGRGESPTPVRKGGWPKGRPRNPEKLAEWKKLNAQSDVRQPPVASTTSPVMQNRSERSASPGDESTPKRKGGWPKGRPRDPAKFEEWKKQKALSDRDQVQAMKERNATYQQTHGDRGDLSATPPQLGGDATSLFYRDRPKSSPAYNVAKLEEWEQQQQGEMKEKNDIE
jgi:hypothetical protein